MHIRIIPLIIICFFRFGISSILPFHTDGKDFWLAFPENNDSGVTLRLIITSRQDAEGEIEIPGLGFLQNFSIAGNSSAEIIIPLAAMATGSGVIAAKGIHVTANAPITLIGMNTGQTSGDAFLALPVNMLDVEYRVMSYPPMGNVPSQFLIVAAYPNTRVTITPPDGLPQQITLQPGETYPWQSTALDLTGTRILASYPVAVFSGHVCTAVPQTAGDCSFLVEQLPPVTTWGSTFFTAPLATRQNGDTFRLLAAENNTDVFLNNSFLVTLNQGDLYELILTDPAFITTQNDKPLLVARFSHSQGYDGVPSSPFMTLISPLERYFRRLNFFIPPVNAIQGYINILAPTSRVDSVFLDGAMIGAQSFQAISNSEFSYAQLPVSPGAHVLTAPDNGKLGLQVYAFPGNAQTSLAFGYPGGWSFPGFITVETEQPVNGEELLVRVHPPLHFRSAFSLLGFRFFGEKRYRVRFLEQKGDFLEGRIPVTDSPERAIEYYISLSDSVVTRFYPPVDPENFPASFDRTFNNYISPHLTLEGGVYKMISVPLQLKHPQLSALFLDDYGEYNTEEWRLFRWIDDLTGYAEFPQLEPEILPGNAYWLITRQGKRFDVDSAMTTSSLEPVPVILSPGWNQVGNPFPFPVDWDSISTGEMIKGPYFYDGIEFRIASRLHPWEGYFVRNEGEQSVELLIPAKPAREENLGKGGKPVAQQFPGASYLLQLSAEIPDSRFRDTQNFVGWSPEASPAVDRLDFPEPPPVETSLRLSLLEGNSRFLSNFKPVPQEGCVWEMALEVPRLPANVELKLNAENMLPEEFEIFLIDEDLYELVPITDGRAVIHFEKKAARERRFKLIVGTRTFAEKNNEGVPLIPTDFLLEQNYPNPFNPVTTITYQLATVSRVRLEIYNLLGQKIRTLVDRRQSGGRHTVQWDGKNDGGQSVASGVYLYRMVALPAAGSGAVPAGTNGKTVFQATRKMILIR